MKYFILISGLLFTLGVTPEIAQAHNKTSEIQTDQNLTSKESDTCINVRGCGRRDKI